jgi:hypothetical protein
MAGTLSSYSETAFLQLVRPTGMIGLSNQRVDFALSRRYSIFALILHFIPISTSFIRVRIAESEEEVRRR